MVTEAAQTAQSLDLVALGTNLGILLGFIVAAILGIKRGIKLIGKGGKEAPNRSHLAAATLLENQTLLLWSESNRDVREALDELKEQIGKNTEALYSTRNGVGAAATELAHQIELLRVQMK